MSKPYTNQASEDDQNKRDIIAALTNDYYEQLKNDSPYMNMTFEEAGCAFRDFATQDVEALIRTEKLKLLAEVRERVVGEYETEYSNLDGDAGYWEKHGRNVMREKQIANLTKLEANQ